MKAVVRPSAARTLIGLCILEFLSWGILFYTLPISATRLATANGWSPLVVPVVYTLSLLSAAAAGPHVGKLIDACGPRRVMAVGAFLGTCGILASAGTDSPLVFALAWMLVGVAQACTLYPPAFAAAAQWLGTASPWPLTVITFAGGLSSAAFAPLTAYLIDSHGWRGSFGLLAGLYGLVSVLSATLLLRQTWSKPSRNGATHTEYLRAIIRSPRFLYTQAALTIAAAGLYAATLNMIPLLEELGFGYQAAAAVFGAVGAGQLLGRLAFIPFGGLGTPRQRITVQIVLTGGALFALALMSGSTLLIVTCAVFAGAVRGAHTLAVATAVSDRWGRDSYATVYGRFNLPIALAMALSPAAGQLAASALGSYQAATLLFAFATLVAVVLALRS